MYLDQCIKTSRKIIFYVRQSTPVSDNVLLSVGRSVTRLLDDPFGAHVGLLSLVLFVEFFFCDATMANAGSNRFLQMCF